MFEPDLCCSTLFPGIVLCKYNSDVCPLERDSAVTGVAIAQSIEATLMMMYGWCTISSCECSRVGASCTGATAGAWQRRMNAQIAAVAVAYARCPRIVSSWLFPHHAILQADCSDWFRLPLWPGYMGCDDAANVTFETALQLRREQMNYI